MAVWHEYPTNYSNGTAVDGAGSYFQWVNYTLGDWWGTGIILLIWIVFFGISLVAGSKKALMVASFVAFIFSIYFVRLDMISPIVVITLIILTIVGAIGAKEEKGL